MRRYPLLEIEELLFTITEVVLVRTVMLAFEGNLTVATSPLIVVTGALRECGMVNEVIAEDMFILLFNSTERLLYYFYSSSSSVKRPSKYELAIAAMTCTSLNQQFGGRGCYGKSLTIVSYRAKNDLRGGFDKSMNIHWMRVALWEQNNKPTIPMR
jgi:hypothetical protein